MEENELKQIIQLVERFADEYEEQKKKLPYNLNILDEAGAYENAHSRILAKLFQLQTDNNYPLLESFLDFLGEPFRKLKNGKVEKITAEIGRIDIRVRGKNYSLIIENKIHGAVDQDAQLKRYIEEEKAYSGSYDKIYVIYLTQSGGEPSKESLPKKTKEKISKRYEKFNYKNHILPWLSKKVHPKVEELKKKDENDRYAILQSALNQYINHLEGMFYQRKGEETMKQELIEYVSKELRMKNTSDTQFYRILQEKEEYAKEFLEIINFKKQEIIKDKIKSLEEKLKKESRLLVNSITFEGNFGEANSVIKFQPAKWSNRYFIGVSFVNDYAKLYCGIQDREGNWKRSDNKMIARLQENPILKDAQETNNLWLYGKYIVTVVNMEFLNWLNNQENIDNLIKEINKLAEDEKITELLKGE